MFKVIFTLQNLPRVMLTQWVRADFQVESTKQYKSYIISVISAASFDGDLEE